MSLRHFTGRRSGPLIVVQYTSSIIQHQALARMETFYESKTDSQTYLSLQAVEMKQLCRNYQAFNLPISTVHSWLHAMQNAGRPSRDTKTASQGNPQGWWRSFTNSHESHLLDYLNQVGCFKSLDFSEAPIYLISVSESGSIHHEALHALFFLHSEYRSEVQRVWDEFSEKCQSTVQRDLTLRGYGKQVWVDGKSGI